MDDLDEVRAALGYASINVFRGSYGTKAALVYLRRHGDHVRSLTLEAIAPPQFLIPLPFAKGVQAAVDGVIRLCEANAACHAGYAQLRQQYRDVLARLEQAPAPIDIKQPEPFVLSKEMFVSKLRTVLYAPQFVSVFPLVIKSAVAGRRGRRPDRRLRRQRFGQGTRRLMYRRDSHAAVHPPVTP